MKNQLPEQLRLDLPHSSEAFDRRKRTVDLLGELAGILAGQEFEDLNRDAYNRSWWTYADLIAFSVQVRGDPPGSAPQVFNRWYDLTTNQLDLLPIEIKYARRADYNLPLLGAVVMTGQIKGPVTRELLTSFHGHRTAQLTREA